jgi:hypothetical protein
MQHSEKKFGRCSSKKSMGKTLRDSDFHRSNRSDLKTIGSESNAGYKELEQRHLNLQEQYSEMAEKCASLQKTIQQSCQELVNDRRQDDLNLTSEMRDKFESGQTTNTTIHLESNFETQPGYKSSARIEPVEEETLGELSQTNTCDDIHLSPASVSELQNETLCLASVAEEKSEDKLDLAFNLKDLTYQESEMTELDSLGSRSSPLQVKTPSSQGKTEVV